MALLVGEGAMREHGISEGRPAAWRRVWPHVAASVVLSPRSVHVLQVSPNPNPEPEPEP